MPQLSKRGTAFSYTRDTKEAIEQKVIDYKTIDGCDFPRRVDSWLMLLRWRYSVIELLCLSPSGGRSHVPSTDDSFDSEKTSHGRITRTTRITTTSLKLTTNRQQQQTSSLRLESSIILYSAFWRWYLTSETGCAAIDLVNKRNGCFTVPCPCRAFLPQKTQGRKWFIHMLIALVRTPCLLWVRLWQ